MMNSLVIWSSVCLSLFLYMSVSVKSEEVRLGIVQWGDTKGLYSPMKENDLPNDCNSTETTEQRCVGGIAVLVPYIEKMKQDLRVNFSKEIQTFATGNLVSGEHGYLSLSTMGWDFYGQLLNGFLEYQDNTTTSHTNTTYRPDFMSLGIKEFEAGLEQTSTYLGQKSNDTRVIISNILQCNSPNSTSPFCKTTSISATFEIGTTGVEVGVVGFVNPLANNISDPGNLEFLDSADAISSVIEEKFKNVAFIIAVGTGSNTIAQKIIDKVGNNFKMIVLYGGGKADFTGKYPTPYKNSYIAGTDGSTYGTSIGSLRIKYDTDTKKLTVTGKLEKVRLTNDIVPNNGILKLFGDKYDESKAADTVAKTQVKLDGSVCWEKECNLGNLVTDSMVHCAYNHIADMYAKNASKMPIELKEPIISVWHGGALHKNALAAGETIRVIDIHRWLPYDNQAYLVRISGDTLWKLFESSATGLDSNPTPDWGQFLQVSNEIQVTYNKKKISQIRTLHSSNGIPEFLNIDSNKEYNVVIPSIMFKGKSVFGYLPSKFLEITESINEIKLGSDDKCVQNYTQALGVISVGFDERIFLSDDWLSCNKKTGLTVFLTLFISAIIVGAGLSVWRFIIVPRRANGNCC